MDTLDQAMSGLKYLKKLDTDQIFRLFIDGRYQKKYRGWVGYENQEQGSVQAMLNGFRHLVENYFQEQQLSGCFIRELHRICLSNVVTDNPRGAAGDIRHLESGMGFFADNTSYEHIQAVLEMRRGDGTPVFHAQSKYGAGKLAEELDAQQTYNAMMKHRRLTYQPWHPVLDEQTLIALTGRGSLADFYSAKHRVQMAIVAKLDLLVDRYHENLAVADDRHGKLSAICELIRELELLHPFPDGNCRVFAGVLLNYLLMLNGFPPACLWNPNLDGLLSLEQWTEEVEKGIARTRKLIKNPDMEMFGYSIGSMAPTDRESWRGMCRDLTRRIGTTREIFLDSHRAALYSSGTWRNLKGKLRFGGIGVKGSYKQGDLYFTLSIDDWIAEGLDVESRLAHIQSTGVVAIVLDKQEYLPLINVPVLVVDDTLAALEQCARGVRLDANPKTVLITGTEGKTGAKINLAHALSGQTGTHAILNSANAQVPVLRTLADLSQDDSVELVEFSVDANLEKTLKGAAVVSPDLCLFTNIGREHMHNHKSIEGVIRNKSAVATSLRPGRTCLVNSSMDTYDAFCQALVNIRSDIKLASYGHRQEDNAVLKDCNFNRQKLGWDVQATVEGSELNYFVPLIQSHAPLASVATLLAVKFLGYDVEKAASAYEKLRPYESMGRVYPLRNSRGQFLFYDQSRRASIAGIRSAFEDIENLAGGGGIIAILGSVSSVNENEWTISYHEELAGLINNSRIDRLYTFGANMDHLHKGLANPDILVMHAEQLDDIYASIGSLLRDGDLVYIQGYMRLGMDQLARKILQKRFMSNFGLLIEKYNLSASEEMGYKTLLALRDDAQGATAAVIADRYEFESGLLQALKSNEVSYRSVRADLLLGFFRRLDSFLQESFGFECINDRLVSSDYQSFVYSPDKCHSWFNHADNSNGEVPAEGFGSFYHLDHEQFLLHVLVGKRNLHIGLVGFEHTRAGIQVSTPRSNTVSAIENFLPEELGMGRAAARDSWRHRPVTIDCGRIIGVDDPKIYLSLVNFETSFLLKKVRALGEYLRDNSPILDR
jgi:UDP-N-acetylmuramoyl-tripeptide--D-alanyl-D-alanine ligase